MASFYYLIAMVLLLCCSTTMFTHENPTVQPENNTSVGCKITRKASANNSTVCNLYVDNEQSKIGELLRIQHKPTINIIKLKIFVVSENETRKMEWPWANEAGRTIISLIWLAKKTIFTSPIFTRILEAGTEEVDIQIKEKTDDCLPPGDEASDRIFEFLLHRVLHSKSPDVFKLCRKSTHHAMYNCCRIVGDKNFTVCADYSSIVVKLALPAVIVVFFISFFLVLPFVLEHVITYPTIKFYKTSDSPMSLTSVVSMMFFESRGRAKSFFRRGVFVALSTMVFLHDFFGKQWLEFLFFAWVFFFMLTYDIQMTHEDCDEECIKKYKKESIEECNKKCIRKPWDKNIISCFTIPFSRPFYYAWPKKKCCQCSLSLCEYLKNLVCGFIICILTILYFLICFPLLVIACLIKITCELAVTFIRPHACSPKECKDYYFVLIRLLTLPNIVFVMSMILIFALFMVVGLTLNAESFNPFVAPIFTLVVYFWKNWKSSVEAKCLELKTSIIEVCMEKAPRKVDEQNVENTTTIINSQINSDLTAGKDYSFRDFLCSCMRDTSTDPHTWKNPLKNSLSGAKPLYHCLYAINKSIDSQASVNNNPEVNSDPIVEHQKKNETPEENINETAPETESGDDGNASIDESGEGDKDIKFHKRREEKLRRIEEKGKDIKTDTKTGKISASKISGNHSTIEIEKGDHSATSKEPSDKSVLPEGGSNEPSTSGNGDNKLIIKFDKHGETMISKELYKMISKEILPLDHLVFYFFRRVIFVGFYAFVMFTVMILSRDSGVSESVQIISAITGVMIPFIFDTIFADHHLSVRTSNNLATKERLKHILKVKRENNTIFVELV